MELTQLFKRHQVTSDNITKFKESLEHLEKNYHLENDNTKLLNEVQQRAFKSTLETLNNELIELETQIKNYQISIEGSKLNLPLESDNKLVLWANQWSGLLGCPIFIVGSQLTDKINPNDVDIVIPMTKEQFEIEFGDINDWANESSGKYSEIKWKWWTRCNKIKDDGFNDTGLKLDVKIQPYSQFYGFMSHWKDLKPYRLDHNPDFDTEHFLTTFFNKKKVNDEEISLKAKSDLNQAYDEVNKTFLELYYKEVAEKITNTGRNVLKELTEKCNKEISQPLDLNTNYSFKPDNLSGSEILKLRDLIDQYIIDNNLERKIYSLQKLNNKFNEEISLEGIIDNYNVEQLIDLQKLIVYKLHIVTDTPKI